MDKLIIQENKPRYERKITFDEDTSAMIDEVALRSGMTYRDAAALLIKWAYTRVEFEEAEE